MSPHAIPPPTALRTALRNIPLSYENASPNSEQSARALLYALFPQWETEEGPVEFVRFKDGITNTLFKAIKKRPGYTDHQIDEDAVLLRAYGNGTEMLIDREREARSHSLLAQYKLAPALLARFDNGLLYRFIEGTPCTAEDLRKDDIARATARRLGQWHGLLPVSDAGAHVGPDDSKWSKINASLPDKPIPNVWTVLRKWIAALPSDTAELQQRNNLLAGECLAMAQLLGGLEGLDHGSYVLAHCDLLSGNVIVEPTTGAASEKVVSFIDYEYATPAPAAFDLANHFAEWGGFDCDYNAMPTISQRQNFLRAYVTSYRTHLRQRKAIESSSSSGAVDTVTSSPSSSIGSAASEEEDADVARLMEEVDAYRGIPGLYWGVWALIQATISQIDFDYASYAETRLQEYWDWKAERDGSRKANGKEMPVREGRWASA